MSFPWAKHYEPKHPLMKWVDSRLPLPRFVYNAVGAGYPVPRNLNFFWNFGVLAGVALTIQIVTGIVLAMHFHSDASDAFNSVNGTIMRDVNAGWFLRYAHANGALVVPDRGLYPYVPRPLLRLLQGAARDGVAARRGHLPADDGGPAFMGYVLPWGQMSFWGAQVITGFFSAIPVVGDWIRIWLLGGFAPDDAALTRFFSLHYLLPFVIAGVIVLHIWALHIPGSSNPTGVEVKGEQDTVPFHPYYTAKDGFGVAVFLLIFAVLVFFFPNLLGDPANYIQANPLTTPAEIKPEWYFWPFYAILRSFTADFILPAKLWGVLAMFSSILLLFFLPWLDTSPVRSAKYRPVYRIFFWILVIDVLVLAWVGGQGVNISIPRCSAR